MSTNRTVELCLANGLENGITYPICHLCKLLLLCLGLNPLMYLRSNDGERLVFFFVCKTHRVCVLLLVIRQNEPLAPAIIMPV